MAPCVPKSVVTNQWRRMEAAEMHAIDSMDQLRPLTGLHNGCWPGWSIGFSLGLDCRPSVHNGTTVSIEMAKCRLKKEPEDTRRYKIYCNCNQFVFSRLRGAVYSVYIFPQTVNASASGFDPVASTPWLCARCSWGPGSESAPGCEVARLGSAVGFVGTFWCPEVT